MRALGKVSISAQEQPLEEKEDPAWYITVVEPQPILASLGDTVWLDENQNGLQDSNELGVPGVQVTLLHQDFTPVGVTTGTNGEGQYLFGNLKPGGYIVEFTIPYGYTFTQSYAGSETAIDSNVQIVEPYVGRSEVINLAEGESNLTIDAGLILAPPVLGIRKVPDINIVRPGGLLTYTITYSNTGGTDAMNVRVTEVVPHYTTLDFAKSTPGWVCDNLSGGGVCSFKLGHVPAQTLNPDG